MAYLAIVDWGIGGLGLYRHIKQKSDLPVLYFSDAGHLPYGMTPRDRLNKRLQKIFSFLQMEGASHIGIACNAANAAFEERKNITGIIRHGIHAIDAGHWKNIGILAGKGTVISDIFLHKMTLGERRLKQQIGQPLSAHVEAGHLDGDALHKDLEKVMAPLFNCDVLLLACTHYPAIADQISRHVNEECTLIDPAIEMGDWILANWTIETGNQADKWYTTGSRQGLVENGLRAFGIEITNVQLLDNNLFDDKASNS